jgi:hypothetical protein
MMKHFLIIFLSAFFLVGGTAFAEEPEVPYLPLLQDGKEWHYQLNMRSNVDFSPITKDLREWIDGDTVADGKTYWKHYCETVGAVSDATILDRSLLREEGKKVYVREVTKGAEESLLYDFDIKKGEQVMDGWLTVQHIDTILVRNVYRRRIVFGKVVWVEGVGCNYTLSHPLGQNTTDGIDWKLMECYENGECVFTYDDFSALSVIIEGIGCAVVRHPKSCLRFDLQGRRLKEAPQKGLYIEEGRKKVVR